ncbi:MAG: serine/threonine protein kinase, partial [Planctomycetes bacterium]|nr:serine/threonine protein kinase [Planctomycetota bacterium]
MKSSDNLTPSLNLGNEALAAAFTPALMTEKPKLADPNIGQEIGPYRVEKFLGAGASGRVYLALHQTIGKKVAIKMSQGGWDPKQRERFLREAKILAQLDHENLLTAFDYGEHEGNTYIIMPYVEAASLGELLEQQGAFSLLEAIDIIQQVARGLQRAHDVGIVHRDIKPSNLLLDRTGRLRVTDFGISRFKNDQSLQTLTATHELLCTPSYMPPEVLRQEVDHRSDIYSLGATFYQLIFNRPPFIADSAIAVVNMHMEKALEFPHNTLPVSQEANVKSIIRKMMAKDKTERYDSMLEVEDVFHKLAEAQEQSTSQRQFSHDTFKLIINKASQLEMNESGQGARSSEGITERNDKEETRIGQTILMEVAEEMKIPADRVEKAIENMEREKRQKTSEESKGFRDKISRFFNGNTLKFMLYLFAFGGVLSFVNEYIGFSSPFNHWFDPSILWYIALSVLIYFLASHKASRNFKKHKRSSSPKKALWETIYHHPYITFFALMVFVPGDFFVSLILAIFLYKMSGHYISEAKVEEDENEEQDEDELDDSVNEPFSAHDESNDYSLSGFANSKTVTLTPNESLNVSLSGVDNKITIETSYNNQITYSMRGWSNTIVV